ncbi:membrane-associated protein, putative [Bodo saltans]|uniref:Membrane-associated protein, putative n=1 Tax=Bodo saltans TaxID=75058 RepID=A0A0S4IV21_BODSA|nr:membrane-associated protein, putative [Bodo saltans]|eukprot:CUF02893.1 membrane-associated protein, putative [Bodo saltans]
MTISVRTFLAIVTAVVGISAAAIAFAPVYTSALSSVEDVVESLREEIGARLQVNVEQYYEYEIAQRSYEQCKNCKHLRT